MCSARRRPSRAWIAALLVALAAIGVGVFLGEAQQVLLNAASICLACMGIG
jgi:hypothetical protein